MVKNFVKTFSVVIFLVGVGYAQQQPAQQQQESSFESLLLDFNEMSNYKEDPDPGVRGIYTGNWVARLNSSADFVYSRKLTYVKISPVKNSPDTTVFSGGENSGNVLGVRVHFPKSDANAFAEVQPLTQVMYDQNGSYKFFAAGRGLISNVSIIKRIRSYIFGHNYPFMAGISLEDSEGNIRSYPLGNLEYTGWRELVYENSSYIEDARLREIQVVPIYPRVEPFIKVNSLTFFRHGDRPTGDFISYLSWVRVNYDKALPDEEDKDGIDDESIWKIRTDMIQKRVKSHMKRVKFFEELIDMERRKMNLPPLLKPQPQ